MPPVAYSACTTRRRSTQAVSISITSRSESSLWIYLQTLSEAYFHRIHGCRQGDRQSEDSGNYKELTEYNPTLDDTRTARIVRNSSHRDGAIYSNKRLQRDFVEGDLADRNETRLEPMMFSKPTDVLMFPQHMLHFFLVVLSKGPISNGSIQLYGYIAARDEKDGMLINYIVNYSRDNPVAVQQGSLIEMTGPKRGIEMCSIVLIEFDMRVKIGTQEDDDLQLIDGALACSGCDYEPWEPMKQRIIGSSGAVDVTLAVLEHAVEATIEVVVVSEVQSGLGLSLSSFLDVMDTYEEVQLFDGIIAQSRPLRRFVVAVPIYTMMFLKVKVGNVAKHTRDGCASRHIKFQPKLHGCTRRQIRLKVATISLKVTWSAV